MADFEIDGVRYTTVKMNGREQFHLLRKLGTLAGVFSRIVTMDMPDTPALRLMTMVVAFAQEFSKLNREQADDLLTHCLLYTRRIAGGNGAGPQTALPMFQGRDLFEDTDIMSLMRICVEVVNENLGGFFPTVLGLGTLTPPPPEPTAPPPTP